MGVEPKREEENAVEDRPVSRGWAVPNGLKGWQSWLPALLIVVAVAALWEWVVAANDIPHWKLPAPSSIGVELWASRGMLLGHTWVTMEEVLIGLALA